MNTISTNFIQTIKMHVETNGIFCVRFNQAASDGMKRSKQGMEKFTFAKFHDIVNCKVPTVCLVELKKNSTQTACYLGVVSNKKAITTLDTRITLKNLKRINIDSFIELINSITENRMKNRLEEQIKNKECAVTSSKLSGLIIQLLAQNKKNHTALKQIPSLIKINKKPRYNYFHQSDAVKFALSTFDSRSAYKTESVIIKKGSESTLETYGEEFDIENINENFQENKVIRFYEDNIIHCDTVDIDEFKCIKKDATGCAIFTCRDEKLTIYTANKLPLEEVLGVDLIYINETIGSIVMIQYKMLKKESGGWIYRPDKQLDKEISRMQTPNYNTEFKDYRLHKNPFFFKFIKNMSTKKDPSSCYISLEHLNKILSSDEAQGPRGGIRVTYENLNGTFLRKADMLGLIRSGYIGTHKEEYENLKPIIAQISQGNNSVVLAYKELIASQQPKTII